MKLQFSLLNTYIQSTQILFRMTALVMLTFKWISFKALRETN